jgi:hypothetical protein
MNTILEKLKYWITTPFKVSFPRFPEAIITSFLLGLFMVINNEWLDFNVVVNDITIALAVLLPLMISVTLLIERLPNLKGYRYWLVGLGLFIAFGFFMYLRFESMATIEIIRFTNLAYALYLLIIFLPFLWDLPQIEIGIVLFFTRFFTALFYSLVLFLGIVIVLVSANVLFNLSIALSVYTNIFIIIMTYVFIPILLATYKKKDDVLVLERDFHIIWQRVFLLVIAPVISIFTGLVVLYFLTGLINLDTYNTEVYTFSALVIAFAGISTQVALRPFQDKNLFIKNYVRYFHFALILVMLGYYLELFKLIAIQGIGLGITIQLILGIWPIAYGVFMMIKRNDATQRGLLALIGSFLVISVVPGLNAVSLTTLLLNAQLHDSLRRYDMLGPDNTIIRNDNLTEFQSRYLFSTLDEMSRLGFDRFPLVPKTYEHPYDFVEVFSASEDNPFIPRFDLLDYNLQTGTLDLTAFNYHRLVWVRSLYELNENPFITELLTINLSYNDSLHRYPLTINFEDSTLTLDLFLEVMEVLETRLEAKTFQSDNPNDFKVSFQTNNFSLDFWLISGQSQQATYGNSLFMSFYLGINRG